MSNKITIVFLVIALIFISTFLIHLYETKDKFKIETINLKSIISMKIFDRGLVGSNSIGLNNKDSIERFSELMKNSKAIAFDKLNLKDNFGLCDIIIYLKNSKSSEFVLISTNATGGIIESGDYCYRNDELLKYIMGIFKNKKPK